MVRKLLIASLLSFAFFTVSAQTKSLSVGIKLLNEIDVDGGTLYPGVGGQLVYRMTKHSGLESGLIYSSQRLTYFLFTNASGGYNVDIAERWLQLPLLYRFNSRLVNFVIGPHVDYFLGWSNKASNPSIIINSYSRSSARIGLSGGLSKTINLSSKLTLEPEGKLIFYPAEESGTIGLNLSLRKKLF